MTVTGLTTLNTYTISGSVGINGVTMNGLPGDPVTRGPNMSGFYAGTVDEGWSGTVTPTMEGYTFNPENIVYENVTGDLSQENYTGTPVP